MKIKFAFLCSSLMFHSLLLYSQYDKTIAVGSFNNFITFNETGIESISDTELLATFCFRHTSINSNFKEDIYYTSGILVSNMDGDTLPNSICLIDNFLCDLFEGGLQLYQGIQMIPVSNSKIFIIAESASENAFYNTNYADKLNYSVLDLSVGPIGSITQKKNILLKDIALASGKINSCRHANGRDWWVLMKDRFGKKYYTFLATPDTIVLNHIQEVGDSTGNEVWGSMVFSPQGDKMIYSCMVDNGINQLFDFDRCTGTLSNAKVINCLYVNWNGDTLDDNTYNGGAFHSAFSPTGRYLYLGNYFTIFQYDTWAENIDSTRTMIAHWDSTFLNPDPNKTVFSQALLAYDGKIYYDQYGGVCDKLHVIYYPDSAGAACGFVHDDPITDMGTNSCYPLPNLPCYRTGRLIGSECDTIIDNINELKIPEQIYLYPNPANKFINYRISPQKQEAAFLEVIDMSGKVCLSQTITTTNNEQLLNTHLLQNGIYSIIIRSNSGAYFKDRFMVWR